MIKLLEEQSAELKTLVCPSPETAEPAGGGRAFPSGQGLQRGLPSLPTKHHSTAGGQPEALCRTSEVQSVPRMSRLQKRPLGLHHRPTKHLTHLPGKLHPAVHQENL